MIFNQQHSNLELEDKVYFDGSGNVTYPCVRAMKTSNVGWSIESKWLMRSTYRFFPLMNSSYQAEGSIKGIDRRRRSAV